MRLLSSLVSLWLQEEAAGGEQDALFHRRLVDVRSLDVPGVLLLIRLGLGPVGSSSKQQAEQLARRASTRQRDGLLRQVEAAKLRLQRELGRYLVCLDSDTADLKDRLYQQMSRDTAGAQRLKQCFEKLGDYPEWSGDLVRELQLFAREVTANRRKARLLGSELDAALQDPRWEAT